MSPSITIHPIAGELTLTSIEDAELRLFSCASQPGCRLVIDLKRLTIMTTPGIGLMLELNRRTKATGGSFILARLTPHIDELFTRTQLRKVLTITTTLDQAVDLLSV